jgi:transposase-like protein
MMLSRDRLGEENPRERESARRTSRAHTLAFEAQAAFAALREGRTLADLAKQFGLHQNQITEWKRQLVEHVAGTFGGGC